MGEQSSRKKQAKFSPRILCSSQRILRSPMPGQHLAYDIFYPRKDNQLPSIESEKASNAD